MHSRQYVLFLLTLIAMSADSAQGQRFREHRAGSKRSQIAANLLRSWDQNGDGLLQSEEVPASQRYQVNQLARRQGLDSTKPLSVNVLISGKGNAKQGAPDPGSPSKTSSEEGKPEKKKKKSEKKSKEADSPAEPEPSRTAVLGFGVSLERPPVPGFGAAVTSAAESPGVDAGSENAESKQSGDRQLQRLTKSMMVQSDKNKNGKLEKSEWGRLRGNPGKSDRNKDGVLTPDELSRHLAGYASRRDVQKKPSPTRRSPRKGVASRDRPTRFLTPHERLPEGLPDWFIQRDRDGDGQLAMAEYASGMSRSTLRKFTELDQNGDGFLVPEEYLAEGKAKRKL